MPFVPAAAGAEASPTIAAGRVLEDILAPGPAGRSTGAPFLFKDSDDASRIWTTARPSVPAVRGSSPA